MHHYYSRKPAPAAKPSHLVSNAANTPSQNLAALRGATSAFASQPKPKLPDVSNLRKQYETNLKNEDTRGRPAEECVDDVQTNFLQRSPSRGRHLSPQDAMLAGARSAAANRSLPVAAQRDQTSSLTAARLASASSSPVRNGTGSTPRVEESGSLPRDVLRKERTGSSEDNTRSKPSIASESYNPQPNRQLPTKTIDLDFNRLPTLSLEHADLAVAANAIDEPAKRPTTAKMTRPVAMPHPKSSSYNADNLHAVGLSLSKSLESRSAQPKPPIPAPRTGRPPVRSLLQEDLTGSRQLQGLSREDAINRMADAMVASSLASTRTSSPTKVYDHALLRRSVSANSLYKLPASSVKGPTVHVSQKPLKQTLRKASPDDDEAVEVTKRGRRHLVRKHPNKHREGDRKRWRDKVTEAERKRYEGVFAANRGILLKATDPRASPSRLVDPKSESNQVVNVVVRDIWERSRLSAQVLEEIYDLVAPNEPLVLHRQQFVVGLWLIDQKLKGRKLPIKVSESVWASVRHSQGIKIGGHVH
ncbi:Increased rDNA silencing protein [Lithohypha guttulata]|uniref:Increased rDNA silencing protein n=1 Tax=Lithohypha guttulata TaxID=1690604 RepID=UPI002DDF716D|nr:Increased rDNA silencing protein [Lithohypha guttulata]